MAVSLDLSARLAAIPRQRYNPTVIATAVFSGDACHRNRKITGAPGRRHWGLRDNYSNPAVRIQTLGLASHAQDLGEFSQLPKLGDLIPEVAIRIKMQVRRIWPECKSALEPTKPVDFGGANPTVGFATH